MAPNRRARFWEYALPEGHRRRRPLGCCFADRVAPDLAGNPLETRSTHLRQTNTPQTATRARWHKQWQLLGEARHEPIGRGGGKPKGTRWGNGTHNANAPAPRISPSPKASPKGALAGVQRAIQPPSWDEYRTRPSARGRCARAEGVGLPEARCTAEAKLRRGPGRRPSRSDAQAGAPSREIRPRRRRRVA